MADVATTAEPGPTAAPTTGAPGPTGSDGPERVAGVLALPVTVAQRLLPDNAVPVVLGAGALVVAGVVEWPAAVAIGLGYLALRRWHRPGAGRISSAAGRG